MTLPYPLLARGKIIDTDMELSEKEKFELQVRENAIRIQIPYGFTADTDVDVVISRADKIAKYVLGDLPSVYEEADLRLKLLNGYEHIRQLLNDLGVPIPILESTSSVWEHTLHALVAYLEKCPPSAGK